MNNMPEKVKLSLPLKTLHRDIKTGNIFTNYGQIGRTSLRKMAVELLFEGISSVMPVNVLTEIMQLHDKKLLVKDREYDLSKGNLFVIGGGKASGMMAKVVEEIVGVENISQGIVVDKDISIKAKKVKVMPGGHPIPDERGIKAVVKMLEMIRNLSKDDLVICLISGGGSALLTYPVDGVSLQDMKKMTHLFLVAGTPIYEMNIVRKHLSRISGGHLARLLQPAGVVSLIISDTLDTKYDATASGPTIPDRSTYSMALDVIKKYGILKKTPVSIINHLEKGKQGYFPETPKEEDPLFKKIQNIIAADNKAALKAIKKSAAARGFDAKIISSKLTGDVKAVAERLTEEIRKSSKKDNVCLVAGGEPTVKVTGPGKGGRCQELAALMINQIKNLKNSTFMAAGTDGSDFLAGVDGAIVDNGTFSQAAKLDLNVKEFLNNNNTYELHEKLNNLILSKPTGTNVNDIMIFLMDKTPENSI